MMKRGKSIFDNLSVAYTLAFLISGVENEASEDVDRQSSYENLSYFFHQKIKACVLTDITRCLHCITWIILIERHPKTPIWLQLTRELVSAADLLQGGTARACCRLAWDCRKTLLSKICLSFLRYPPSDNSWLEHWFSFCSRLTPLHDACPLLLLHMRQDYPTWPNVHCSLQACCCLILEWTNACAGCCRLTWDRITSWKPSFPKHALLVRWCLILELQNVDKPARLIVM